MATPIRTPRNREWKAFGTPRGERRATSSRSPAALGSQGAMLMREGSLVQLRGLENVEGINYSGLGNFDASLSKYNGRKGRVSRNPPAWVIKAAAEPSTTVGALIPVLLDSRSSDRDRGHGVWVAVPAANLRVLS